MKRQYIPYNLKLTKIARINRKNHTEAEEKFWDEVLKTEHFKNYKFHRQKPLDNFIVDFYCSKLLLVIEIDGDSHVKQKEYDEIRSEKLDSYGIRVIRYNNNDVLQNIKYVRQDLFDKIGRLTTSPDKGRRGGVLLTNKV